MKSNLVITVSDQGSTLLVRLEGEMDASETRRLRERFYEALREDYQRLIFNLNAVRYIDSTGLQFLIEVRKRLRVKECAVVLAAVPERLRRVLKITRLEALFPMFETEADALTSMDLLACKEGISNGREPDRRTNGNGRRVDESQRRR